MSFVQPAVATCLPVLWTVALLRRDRFVLPAVTHATIKFTHVLPTLLQIALFTYWSIYWPGVIEHLPVLAAQLVLAYAFDFLLSWTLRLPYSPSLGPLPIVLSTNLFVWFPPDSVLLYALVIVVALSSKALIRSGGRHLFNPSVLGITVVGILCIVLPRFFQYQDISHDFDRPPQMALVIILLALIPQIRLGTAPVAVGAALSMVGTMLIVFSLTGYRGGPSPWWPPWLLAITLLAPDPATIPSASVSRLLFGLFLGVTFYVVSRALLYSIGTDFFSKIIPISMANLLVPSFERVGGRLSARWPSLQSARAHGAYIASWVTMSALILILAARSGP
jgi:hypothetical protein